MGEKKLVVATLPWQLQRLLETALCSPAPGAAPGLVSLFDSLTAEITMGRAERKITGRLHVKRLSYNI